MAATGQSVSSKLSWSFDRNLTDAEQRKSRALEHIAYYLDRIDAHLEVIAQSAQTGGFNEGLRMELLTIRELS